MPRFDRENYSNDENSFEENEEKIFLEECFYVSASKKNEFHVKLSERGLTLIKQYKDGKNRSHVIPIQSIIGVCCLKFKPVSKTKCFCVGGNFNKGQVEERHKRNLLDRDSNDAYIYIYTYITKNRRNRSYKERNTIALRFRSFDKYEQNAEEANKWKNSLMTLLYQDREKLYKKLLSVKGYLIFLNPKSGKGNARDIFHKTVAPVLADANIQFDLFITKSANFARQFVRTKNLHQWSAIVILGGDGLFFEVVNGIFERHDWQEAIDYLHFGIIPAGSGNGLAKTFSLLSGEQHDETSILSSSISLVNGTIAPMDLVRIETKDEIIYSSLACGWGFISDVGE